MREIDRVRQLRGGGGVQNRESKEDSHTEGGGTLMV